MSLFRLGGVHQEPDHVFLICLCFYTSCQEILVEVNGTITPCALAAQIRNHELSLISYFFTPTSN